MADIKIFGKNVPKWVVYGGVIGGGGGLIYAYVHNKNKAAATTAATTTANTYGYGSYAYGSAPLYAYGTGVENYGYGAYTNAYGYGSGAVPVDNAYGYGSYGSGISAIAPTQVTTNAEWTQQALSQLTNQGYTGQQVLSALGQYTTGQPVSTANQPTVAAAIAVEGYPPVPGAGGYPPAIKTAGTTGGGTGGGQTEPNVKVPKVTGMLSDVAFAVLHTVNLGHKDIGVKTSPTTKVSAQSPVAGTTVPAKTIITLTHVKG
jgi:hypothetical protein